VILGGFLTNCCVESTMRTAYEKGYDVITLTDCTAATSDEEQQVATARDYPMFSQPMTSDQVVEALNAAAAVGGSSGD
jgi:ureidoacrylate peracid hydrolase